MKYVFFGSGPVAVESFKTLRKIFNFDYVVTKATTSRFFQPLLNEEKLVAVTDKKSVDDFITTNINGETIGILIDFGVIISEQTINTLSHGIVNSHFSLLPSLRGADPITHSILRGDQHTGVSMMLVDKGMDTGDIIAQAIYDIPSDIYANELSSDLIDISNAMLTECVPLYLNGTLEAMPQVLSGYPLSYAPKIQKVDGTLEQEDTAEIIDKKVRAFYGWPGVKTQLGAISVTIEKGKIVYREPHEPHRSTSKVILHKDEDGKHLLLSSKDGLYEITQLKPDGKKSMSAEAFLAGYAQKITFSCL